MRRKNVSKEEAEAKFEKDVANNADEKEFQRKSLLGECSCPFAKDNLEDAKGIAEELGYRDEDIIVCEHSSKSEIGDRLRELKQIAQNAEDDKDIKAQAIVIINIGNMINPAFASHKDLLGDLGLEFTSNQTSGYFNEFQLTEWGELYNLSEAAAWLTYSPDKEQKDLKTNVIVLNHYAGLLPQLFKQHIRGSDQKEELKK